MLTLPAKPAKCAPHSELYILFGGIDLVRFATPWNVAVQERGTDRGHVIANNLFTRNLELDPDVKGATLATMSVGSPDRDPTAGNTIKEALEL